MDAPRCQACETIFNTFDELQSHRTEDSCKTKTDKDMDAGVDLTPPNPITVATPELPSSTEVTESSSHTDTSQPTAAAPTGDVPEVVLTSTQEIINLLSEKDVPAVIPSGKETGFIETPETAKASAGTATESTNNDSANKLSEDDHEDPEVKNAIAALCVDAPSTKVRDIIRLYSSNNTYEKQKSLFNSRCNKGDMVETLQFLGDPCTSWKDVKKMDCAHKLHYRLQNLMPEECGVCNETYIVGKDDPSLLACSVCGQEVHHKCYKPLAVLDNNGLTVMEALKMIPGFHHLCPSCEDAIIPDERLIERRALQPPHLSRSQDHNVHKDDKQHQQSPLQQPSPLQQEQEQKQQHHQPPVLKKQPPPQEPPKPPHHATSPTDDSSPHADETHHDDDRESCQKNQTCRHYKNNTCRFGISGKGCSFVHPKRCSKLMNHGTRAGKGCNKGNKCEDFHPKMCPLSISKSECFDQYCTLCHVKGTRRNRPPVQKEPSKAEEKLGAQIPKNDHTSSLQCRDEVRSTVDQCASTTDSAKSFLDQISLLKKELQETMDKKFETLMKMQSPQNFQQNSQIPFIPAPTQPYAPMPWIPQMYPMQRSPMIPMGY